MVDVLTNNPKYEIPAGAGKKESMLHHRTHAAEDVPQSGARKSLPDSTDEESEAEQLRCMKCYSADVTCREVDKPVSYLGANLLDPITVHARSCRCNACGYEWDDEDT
jgi:hypothetical protein